MTLFLPHLLSTLCTYTLCFPFLYNYRCSELEEEWSTLKTEVTLTTCRARLEYHRVMSVAYGRHFALLHLSCDFYLRPSGPFVIKREIIIVITLAEFLIFTVLFSYV